MTKKKQRLSDEDYKFIFSQVPRLCVDLINSCERKILLTERSIHPYKNLWHLPGGRLFHKESISSAIQRIAKAELGIDIPATTEPKLAGYIETPRDGKFIHSVSMAFIVKIDRDTANSIKTDFQSNRFDFFDKLPSRHHPPQGNFLRKQGLMK